MLWVEAAPAVLDALADHADYLRGVLPRPGGLLAQEARWLLLQRAMESERSALRAERDAAQAEERKRGAGKGRRGR